MSNLNRVSSRWSLSWQHVLLVLACLSLAVDGLRVSDKHVLSERFITTFDQFTMEAASVSLTATVGVSSSALSMTYTDAVVRSAVRIMICPERRYMTVVQDANSASWVCWQPGNHSGPQIPDCYNLELNGTNYNIYVAARSNYRFIVVNCLKDNAVTGNNMVPVVVTTSYTATNMASGNLGVGYQRMPVTYGVLSIFWALLFAGWALLTFWQWRLRNAIHRALWIVMIARLAVSVVAFIYWHIFDVYGIRVDGLAHARSVTYASSEAVMFSVFMLIAKGWLITRHTLPSGEIRGSILALIILLGSLLFLSFYSDEYYYMAMLIMYFFMLPKVFSALTRNSRLLQSELWVLERFEDGGRERSAELLTLYTHTRDKADLFSRLRRALGAYLVCLVLVNSLRLVMGWEFDWVLTLLNELNAFYIMSAVSLLCRPQRTGVFAVLANRHHFNFDWRRVLADAGFMIGDPAALDAVFNMPQVQPWDVSKSFVIEWPHSSKEIDLALAVEENYDRHNMGNQN